MKEIQFQCRPIDVWPGQYTRARKNSQFKAGYGDTVALLDQELRHIKAKSVVLLMALRPEDIRLDGRPRGNAQASHPGVIVVAETANGTLRFPCDKFLHWADNLRAIAKSLEALRMVDRYGVTRSGEQYRGWAALPAPQAPDDEINTLEKARGIIEQVLDARVLWGEIDLEYTIRLAKRKTHPDTGGSAELFKRVCAAEKVLSQS